MDLTQIIEVTLKFTLAILIGGFVGFERGNHNSPAGFRTHILVCLGTTIISMIQLEMVNTAIALVDQRPELINLVNIDYARLGAQAITGMGFLGAGSIIQSKGAVKGLTTAASLWVVGTLGLAVGMGYYVISIGGTIGIFLILVVLKKVQTKFLAKVGEITIEARFKDNADIEKTLDYLDTVFMKNNIRVMSMENIDNEEERGIIYRLNIPVTISVTEAMNEMFTLKGIKKIDMI